MTRTTHWPEYLIEGTSLALFMVSAASFATLLRHPASPLSTWIASPLLQRVPMGMAMGLTLVAIVYSPLGVRSGAHLNPAVTLTFLRLGKLRRVDAAWYIVAQFAGGAAGIAIAAGMLRGLPAHPSVNYVATVPGPAGASIAFVAEAVISFGMMWTVLWMSNDMRVAGLTGVGAGVLVAIYIVVEAPLSGMSMNPARTLGPAMLSRTTGSLWIYFTAPLIGMLAASETYIRAHGRARVRCAKLHHVSGIPCIFHCGYAEQIGATV